MKRFLEPDRGEKPGPKGPDRTDIRKNLEAQAASAMIGETTETTEDDLIDALDEKALLLEMMREILPTWRRLRNIRDPEAILQLAGPHAARTLMHAMMFGNIERREVAATKILDRVIGKPVERKMTLSGDLHKLSEQEVDREIGRILQKLGPGELAGILREALPRGEVVIAEAAEDSGEAP
ncbi:MAG TPA: hypothetical protein VFW62_01565 [bacterium]|nr:hypothetical protein [bacterium]